MLASLGRRAFTFGAVASPTPALAAATAPTASSPLETRAAIAEWAAFRARFIQPDGRVVDTGNEGVSHSESQAYGLLLSVGHNDRGTFERILGWSRGVLGVRDDYLMAWRYRHGASSPVDDLNNATDGDLMFAWALARAHDRWGVPEHLALSRTIARDMLRVLMARAGSHRFLLPGSVGFFHGDRIVLNPSYHVVPALRRMASVLPDPSWDAVIAGGDVILEASRRGQWRLPPDWAQIDREGRIIKPSSSNPARFGYDAVRVPLNLIWSGRDQDPTVLDIAGFWSNPPLGRAPGWVDLRNNAMSPEPASDGHRAISAITVAAAAGWRSMPWIPSATRAHDYYSASLTMLTRLALADLGKTPLSG